MSYIALYRKWRPLTFEDVVEQAHVVKTLKHAVSTDRIAHAYLFCGTRGTGKTTMAHILSRAVNCLNPKDGDPCNECEICHGIHSGSILDVLEIDAASNNSVDNIRDIREDVVYTPSKAKYKVYIIDEVHMLSTGAFNALLKTLEEPPAHVIFILATTEPHKLPATILSRCQRFDFRRITVESIVGRLEKIAQSDGITLHPDAARLIAKMSDGAMRDAISLLDQCIALGNTEITHTDVLAVIGLVNDTFLSETVDALTSKNVPNLLERVEKLLMDGKDISQFTADLIVYYRNLMICKVTPHPEDMLEVSIEAVKTLTTQAAAMALSHITAIIKELSALENQLKWATQPRILLEVTLIGICEDILSDRHAGLVERLETLERLVRSGTISLKTETPAYTVHEDTAFDAPSEKKIAVSLEIKELSSWKGIIDELKSMGRMALYANLIDSKAVVLSQKQVAIVFPSGSAFKKMLVSKSENMEIVQNVLIKKIGRDVRLKCIDEEQLAEQSQKATDVEDPEDELILKAKEIAQKLNVPMDIVDE